MKLGQRAGVFRICSLAPMVRVAASGENDQDTEKRSMEEWPMNLRPRIGNWKFDAAVMTTAWLLCIMTLSAETWTAVPIQGAYYPTTNKTVLPAAVLDNVQHNQNDALTKTNAWASAGSGNNISGTINGWFAVCFPSNNFPGSGVNISSAKVRVDYAALAGAANNRFTLHLSTNKAYTQWYKVPGTTNPSAANNGSISFLGGSELSSVWDVTTTLNTTNKINNCEVLVLNRMYSTTNRLYLDYIDLEVTYTETNSPILDNDTGATDLASTSAVLNGSVAQGDPDPDVWIYWGTNNAGQSFSWSNKIYKGTVPIGSFTNTLTGLQPNRTYYYRCYGSNMYGTNWAPATAVFTTLPIRVEFAVTNMSGSESNSLAQLQLVLSATSAVPVSVDYSVVGGTASNGPDYSLEAGTAIVPAGSLSTYINIPITNDVMIEDDETIIVGISNATVAVLGSTTQCVYTILDDDPRPPDVNNDTGAEDVTWNSARLTGMLVSTGDAPAELWIYWGTGNGNTNKTGWITNEYFGQVDSGPFFTNLTGLVRDTRYWYRCYASNIYGGAWAPASTNFGTGPPEVQFAGSAMSGSEAVSPALLPIQLSNPSVYDMPVTFSYSTMGGTAVGGVDYFATNGVVTIPSGIQATNIQVAIVNRDIFFTGNRTFIACISNTVNSIPGQNSNCLFTIVDDDPSEIVRIVSMGDLGTRGDLVNYVNTEALSNVVNSVLALNPRPMAVAIAGDMITDIANTDYPDSFKLLTNCLFRLVTNGIPYFCAVGNHDTSTSDPSWYSIWAKTFSFPTNGPAQWSKLLYYTNVGAARLVFLDPVTSGTNYTGIIRNRIDSTERAWLNSVTGTNSPALFDIAVGHESPYRFINQSCLDANPSDRDAFVGMLVSNKATMYISGHHHVAAIRLIDTRYDSRWTWSIPNLVSCAGSVLDTDLSNTPSPPPDFMRINCYSFSVTDLDPTTMTGTVTICDQNGIALTNFMVKGKYREPSLTVRSSHGASLLDDGLHTNTYGDEVFCVVTNTCIADLGTQYVFNGWSGSGSIPASGVETGVSVKLREDSSITWLWTPTNYWFGVGVTNGTTDATNGWIAIGSNQTAMASPWPYYHFNRWGGDTNDTEMASNTISVAMTRPRSIIAWCAPNLATNNTPEWWLAAHELTNRDWNTEALDDQDNDDADTWQEWVADTDPTNGNSVLVVTGLVAEASGMRIYWKGGTGVWQYLQSLDDLTSTTGVWEAFLTNSPPTPVATNVLLTNTPFRLFYRVKAER